MMSVSFLPDFFFVPDSADHDMSTKMTRVLDDLRWEFYRVVFTMSSSSEKNTKSAHIKFQSCQKCSLTFFFWQLQMWNLVRLWQALAEATLICQMCFWGFWRVRLMVQKSGDHHRLDV